MKVKKMAENPQTQTQIQTQDENLKKQIISEILEKLKFARDPEIKDLVVLPTKFMTIPTLQRFAMAPSKFKKIRFNTGLAYTDGEGIIVYSSDFIKLYIKPRYSTRIYAIKYEDEYGLPEGIRPKFYLLTEDGSQYIDVNYSEELVKYIFGLEIELEHTTVFNQGHLYAFDLWHKRNIELWLMKDTDNTLVFVDEIFGHKLVNAEANMLTSEIYYVKSENDVIIQHNEHGELVLPKGEYLLYHPRPRSGKVD